MRPREQGRAKCLFLWMNVQNPTSAFDDLPLPSDQRAALREFVTRAKSPETNPASGGSALSADAVAYKAPASDATGKTATTSRQAAAVKQRACLLIITASPPSAEPIARAVSRELGRDLLPVDLSRVLSKFIAETEKHLEELFDLAGEDGSILFFDEADALFGSDAAETGRHFADQEVGYLLHHIESFEGVSILSVQAGTPIAREVQARFTAVIHV